MTTRVASQLLVLLVLLLPLPRLAHEGCMMSLPAEETDRPAGLAPLFASDHKNPKLASTERELCRNYSARVTEVCSSSFSGFILRSRLTGALLMFIDPVVDRCREPAFVLFSVRYV